MTNVNIIHDPYQKQNQNSDREWVIALLLCLFFGWLGVHRFYVGKIGTGLLLMFSSAILIGFFWAFIDLIMIACSAFRDKEGRKIDYRSSGGVSNVSHTVVDTSADNSSSDKKFDVHVATELKELSALKKEGILTEAEFNKKKKQLLNL